MEYKSLPYLGNDVAWMECNALPYQCIDMVVGLLNRMTILILPSNVRRLEWNTNPSLI
jgi:hypothetical protein